MGSTGSSGIGSIIGISIPGGGGIPGGAGGIPGGGGGNMD